MEIELLDFTRQNLFLLILMKSIRIDMRTNLLFLFLFFGNLCCWAAGVLGNFTMVILWEI
jgi:hypothetical protein